MRFTSALALVTLQACYDGLGWQGGDDGASGHDVTSEGSAGDSAGSAGSGAESGEEGGDGGEGGAEPEQAGPMPLRRLTRREYDNTVRDLFGVTTRPAEAFAGEGLGSSGFASPGLVSGVDVLRFIEASEAVSREALVNLETLLPCDPTVDEGACAEEFVKHVGRRVFRRPLSPSEVATLVDVYDHARDAILLSFSDRIRLVLQAMLQAPQFLYRWELGLAAPVADDQGVVTLTGYEVASRLSFFLWSSTPDDALLDAAERGELDDAESIDTAARRLLADDRARDTIDSFHTQWLQLEALATIPKEPTLYPEFDDELRLSMQRQLVAFVDDLLRGTGDGTFSTFMTASYSFLDESLAELYGIDGITGTELRRVDLDPEHWSGVLTLPAFLSVTANAYDSSPIQRGKRVRLQFLCQNLSPPNMVPELEPREPGQSKREQYESHWSDPVCRSCHRLMDPIGFGLEHFDGIGRWRDRIDDLPIDASGEIANLDGSNVSFDGARELAEALAESEEARECLMRQWFRFGFGREEGDEDEASLDATYRAFADSGFDLRELIVALTRTRTFRQRLAAEGEVTR